MVVALMGPGILGVVPSAALAHLALAAEVVERMVAAPLVVAARKEGEAVQMEAVAVVWDVQVVVIAVVGASTVAVADV